MSDSISRRDIASVYGGDPRQIRALEDLYIRTENSPTKTELDDGYDNDDPNAENPGTTTPDTPTIEVEGDLGYLVVRISRQSNLTNWSHNEVQVSADGSPPWYKPVTDGTIFGTIDETQTAYQMFVHARVPAAGTDDSPTGRTLHYRARTVTTAEVESDWSTVVSGTTRTVDVADIAPNAVNAAKIVDDAITNAKIAAGAVGAAEIVDGAIIEAKIGTDAVTTTKIINDAINQAKIAAGAIGTTELIDAAITAAKIGTDAVTTTKIIADAITQAKIAAGAIGTDQLIDGAVSTLKVASGAITSEELANLAVEAAKLASGAVTEGKIAASAVTAGAIAAGAVIAGKIAADAVTATEIAANAVTADAILAGEVTTAKLAAAAVTANEIAANAVIAGKIAADAVTATTIATDAVTADAILAGEITTAKLAAAAVTANEIASNAITAIKIAAEAVHAENLSVLARNNVNNPTLSGNIYGWGGIDEGGEGSSAYASYDATEKALKLTTSGNNSARSDTFSVDPNKIYRLKFRIKKSAAHGRYYVGLSAFTTWTVGTSTSSAGGTESFGTVNEDRTIDAGEVNAYFYYEDPADTDYRSFEVYIVGANRSVDEFPDYTLPAGGAYRHPAIQIESAETPWVAVRFLSWNNTISTDLFIRDISVSEVGGGTIVAENILAETITGAKIAAGTIESVNIKSGNITTGLLDADAVTTAKIAADAVTSNEIDVDNLRAISADMGTLTAGKLESTDWDASNGVEFDLTNGRLRMGGSSNPAIDFNEATSSYTFRGSLKSSDGDSEIVISDTEVSITADDSAGNITFNGEVYAGKVLTNELVTDALTPTYTSRLVMNSQVIAASGTWTIPEGTHLMVPSNSNLVVGLYDTGGSTWRESGAGFTGGTLFAPEAITSTFVRLRNTSGLASVTVYYITFGEYYTP